LNPFRKKANTCVLVGAMVALAGGQLGKLRSNFMIGIRTPWTLASDQVWQRTHRLARWPMMLSGLAIVLAAPEAILLWRPTITAAARASPMAMRESHSVAPVLRDAMDRRRRPHRHRASLDRLHADLDSARRRADRSNAPGVQATFFRKRRRAIIRRDWCGDGHAHSL
jgi:SdpI/YfhL protein family